MFDLLPGGLAGILCSVMQEAWIWSLTPVTMLLGIHGYKNKSISLQPSCCVLCSRQISHVQQGQPCSGLTWLGGAMGMWKGTRKEKTVHEMPSSSVLYPKDFLVYFCLPSFSDVPLFHKYVFFFPILFKWAKAITVNMQTATAWALHTTLQHFVPWRTCSPMDSVATGCQRGFGT